MCQGFTNRFEQLGGKIVKQESFTQGDKTINSVVSRVNGEKPSVIAFCTSFAGDQPAFVAGLRSLGNKTPIMNSWAGDGAYWWTKNPKVSNFYFVTYAGAVAKDPDAVGARVRGEDEGRRATRRRRAASSPAPTRSTRSPTRSSSRAARRTGRSSPRCSRSCTKFQTLGGPISFTPELHSVTGRPYRVIVVNGNKAKVLTTHSAKVIADIH